MLKKKENYKYRDNLTQQERKALDELKSDLTITIRQADKGGGIVIQDRDIYINEAYRLLTP